MAFPKKIKQPSLGKGPDGASYVAAIVPTQGLVVKLLSAPTKVTGTLLVTDAGLQFLPKGGKKMGRMIAWRTLARIAEVGLA